MDYKEKRNICRIKGEGAEKKKVNWAIRKEKKVCGGNEQNCLSGKCSVIEATCLAHLTGG